MSRKNRLVLLATAVVVAIAATIGIVLTTGFGQNDSQTDVALTQPSVAETTSVPVPTPSAQFADANAVMLEAALNSSSKAGQAKALIPELREEGEWTAGDVLPEGAVLTIDKSSFRLIKDGYASVDAEVTGTKQGSFTLQLQLVDDQWLVYMSEEKR